MLSLILRLFLAISKETSSRTTNSAPNAILHTVNKIAGLALCLLSFPLLVLLDPLILETLCTDQSANGLFGRTDCLVPTPFCAVWIVGCDRSGGGRVDRADLGDCVRCGVLSAGFGLLVLALALET